MNALPARQGRSNPRVVKKTKGEVPSEKAGTSGQCSQPATTYLFYSQYRLAQNPRSIGT